MPIDLPATHTCTAGETWGGIAWTYYAEETLMHHIIADNPLYSHTLVFEGGEQIIIPAIRDTDRKAALPPWRR